MHLDHAHFSRDILAFSSSKHNGSKYLKRNDGSFQSFIERKWSNMVKKPVFWKTKLTILCFPLKRDVKKTSELFSNEYSKPFEDRFFSISD